MFEQALEKTKSSMKANKEAEEAFARSYSDQPVGRMKEPTAVHPNHYSLPNGLQVFDLQKVVCSNMSDVYAAHCVSDALKYIMRAGRKDLNKTAEDIDKAIVYLQEASKTLKGGE